MTVAPRRLVLFAASMLVVAACGDDRVLQGAATPTDPAVTGTAVTEVGTETVPTSTAPASTGATATGSLPTITPMKCPENADCSYGFMLGEEFVEVSCEAVRPELVTGELLALDGEHTTSFSVIEGVDPTLAGAVHDTMCDESTWSFARRSVRNPYSTEDGALEMARARCAVLVAPQPYERCDAGGRARWNLSEYDPDMHVGNGWATFPEWMAAMDAAATVDPAGVEGWRLDPLQVAVHQLLDDESVGSVCGYTDLYPGCRVLLRAEPRDGADSDTVDFDGILQWIVPMNQPEELFAETYPLRITLERHGSTWWPVRYQEGPNVQHGSGDDGRAAADAAAAGFDVVVVEWEWPLTTLPA